MPQKKGLRRLETVLRLFGSTVEGSSLGWLPIFADIQPYFRNFIE